MKELLLHKPEVEFPDLTITCAPDTPLEDLQFSDFKLENYHPHGKIKMKLNTGLNVEDNVPPCKKVCQ